MGVEIEEKARKIGKKEEKNKKIKKGVKNC